MDHPEENARSLSLGGRKAVRAVTVAEFTEALEAQMNGSNSEPIDKLDKSKPEWRRLLPADQFAVLFEEATERPYSHPLNGEKRAGTFLCSACGLPLFTSGAKFDSGTGWPSFTQPIPGHIATRKDLKLIVPRTEYHCVRCGGHQGHVFNDGPQPTGQRWCNNGLALHFIPEGDAVPPLRP